MAHVKARVTTQSGTPSILVADDNPYDVQLLKYAFIKDGRSVNLHAYANGTEVLSSLRQGFLPDVLILDLNLPGYTGMEVMRNLQTCSQWEALSFVILSGLFPPDERRLAEVHGALCLEKPLNIEGWAEVVGHVHNLINACRSSAGHKN